MKFNLKFTYAVAAVAFLGILSGCSKPVPSKEQLQTGGKLCGDYVAKLDKRDSTHPFESEIFDSWMKDGKVIFDVGTRDQYSDDRSYSMRRCIYDEKNGTLTALSPSDQGKWDK